MTKGIRVIAAVLMLGTPLVANSIPITWSLDNVVFDDGGTATGSFVFDADTGAYSAAAIVTSAGGALGGAIYDTTEIDTGGFSPFTSNASRLTLLDGLGAGSLVGKNILELAFSSALTNLGGSTTLVSGYFDTFEGTCGNASCGGGVGNRTIRTGQIIAVPEPGTFVLFGAVLLGLGLARRRPRA